MSESIDTYALLDDGATATFIDSEIAAKLGVTGPQKTIHLDCVGGLRKETTAQYVDFHVKGRSSNEIHFVRRARAIAGLGAAGQCVRQQSVAKYPYLSDIADEFCYGDVKPTIIIGIDNWYLTVAKAIRNGSKTQPVAIRTALGWVLFGFGCSTTAPVDFVNHTSLCETELGHSCDRSELELLIREQYKLDSIGISKHEIRCANDDRAVEIVERSASRLHDGRFQVGLLWKSDKLLVPDSYKLAFSRFLNLERKMIKDPAYAQRYRQNIHDMLRKDYAELCTEVYNAKSVVWYLPHFGVVNPNKPDRDAQRFLWRDNPTEPIKVYRMSSMIFGAASSPFTALYIKNKNATEFQDSYPDAAKAIVLDHYMDDYMGSLDTTEQAARLAADIYAVHKNAGFEMRSWVSNDLEALSLLPKESLLELPVANASLGVDLGSLATPVRTLGLIWRPAADTIGFNTGVTEQELPKKFTKREVLAHVMRIYDPLGILAPIVVRGRIMFQNAWHKGLDWDEKLSQSDTAAWSLWFEDLLSISDLQIPRWYSLNELQVEKCELHIFADSSESAYAAVAYWRFLYTNGSVKLALICSKVRVAPLKPVSIPRLELQGALIAARLATSICEAHRLKASRRVFWSDSMTVLGWLRSDARSFKPFVAHRVGEILETTNVKEWHWVPSHLNVADDATRLKRTALTQECRWISGPEFLLSSDWPSEPHVAQTLGQDELKPSFVVNFISYPMNASSQAPPLVESDVLTAGDIRLAEVHVLRQSQLDSFSDEVTRLLASLQLLEYPRILNTLSSSTVDTLLFAFLWSTITVAPPTPTQRLSLTNFDSNITYSAYEKLSDPLPLNVNYVAYVVHTFQPPIGNLPEARLAHHRRPFTFVGLDYFGPIQVAVGRRREKRYVALFTCLVVRAIHLEVVQSLSADAAIMALRRFVARRGTPTEIWSDNGTAFVGANRELWTLYASATSNYAANEKINWRFLPPSAPFMGGAWERLVRNVRTALRVTLTERTPSDEVLRTLLAEAEALVNARPLTHVSSDSTSEEALTPAHFLLGSSSGRPIPATMTEADLLSRSSWRRAMRLTDHFWRRWVREYLPTLVPRSSNGEAPSIAVGDLVLIADGNLPRGSWPRGRVTALFPGRDGIVRVADVATTAGVLRRPLKKLVRIPAN
ncbi:uncharacterized protein [Choristoneura fumiferana]|uniref:uncharacterized protein n=1 Tax=Choristoneura fumiferana TaxID=7141 RepID=UPI003D15EB45